MCVGWMKTITSLLILISSVNEKSNACSCLRCNLRFKNIFMVQSVDNAREVLQRRLHLAVVLLHWNAVGLM
jgi:hypothetical protein